MSFIRRDHFCDALFGVDFVLAVVAVEAVHVKNENRVAAKAKEGQKWGFLKNIVNIDRFFDSGVKA